MSSLTVITLTRNRLGQLEALRERLLPQLGPGDEWLIIDTGSTDGTRERFVARGEAPREGSTGEETAAEPVTAAPGGGDPRIRLIAYDGGGSWAEIRNLGVRQARGALLAFLDDDCLPEADWAARGKAQLMDENGGCDAVGGMARPRGIREFPRWWHPDMAWMAGLSVPAHALPELAGRVAYPFTANLFVRGAAARAEPFQELGGAFDAPTEAEKYSLGREDAEWWLRLRTRGYATRFDAKLAVGHGIDPARLDLTYLLRRAELDGRAWAAREGRAELARAEIRRFLYLAWGERMRMAAALLREPGAGLGEWHLHRLWVARHLAAARGLQERFIARRAEAEEGAGGEAPAAGGAKASGWGLAARSAVELARFVKDRAKTAGRELLWPWLRAREGRPWRRPVERLGVIAFGYLGDLIILQSALRGLMEAHPEVDVYVLAPQAGATALAGVKRLNVTLLPAGKPGREAGEFLSGWLERLDPCALAAPYPHAPWGDALTRLRRLPCPVAAFDGDHTLTRQWQQARFSVQVHKSMAHHEAENLCNLFGWTGLPCEPRPARLTPDAGALARARADALFAHAARRGGGVVLLNPDAGQSQKEWSDERWAELARRIVAETPHGVAINASRPHEALEEMLKGMPERAGWLRGVPLEDLTAWVAASRGLITVDAGPQHLAHALGTPSLTLYGPMDERRWGDYFKRPMHRVVRGCASGLTPDEKRGLPENQEMLCLRAEPVWRAWQALEAEEVAKRDAGVA